MALGWTPLPDDGSKRDWRHKNRARLEVVAQAVKAGELTMPSVCSMCGGPPGNPAGP
jgi:hypothetical protein